MEVAFYCSDKEREARLADAFLAGLGLDDWGYKVFKSTHAPFGTADVICMVGVKSLDLFRAAREAGKHVVYLDKGYFRHRGPNRTWEYWRIAVNDHHPTDYISVAKHKCVRWDKLAHRRLLEMKMWREDGRHILYAGSSDKYHRFADLPDPTTYAKEVVRQIRKYSDRKIVYRPKPTWLEAEPIKGTEFSGRDQNIGDVLRSAWCVVTNGSNSVFEAMIAGIPCITLGRGIGRPIGSNTIEDIEKPRIPTYGERDQWLYNLAWCMFSEEEMKHGLAWAAIRPQLSGDVVDEAKLKYVAGRQMKPSKAVIKRLAQISGEEFKRLKAAKRMAKQRKWAAEDEDRQAGDGGSQEARGDTPDKSPVQET